MAEYSDLRLGCIIPEVFKPVIQYANIVPSREGPADAPDAQESAWEPVNVAKNIDNLAPFESWNQLGNDRYDDCVSVTWANMRRLITSKLTGSERYPDMNQVMQLYRTQRPDGHPDGGMDIEKVLALLVDEQKETPDGAHALAFVEVDWKNFQQLREALAIFGALWIELKVDRQNQEEFDYQQPWTAPVKPQAFGHSVLCGGCTEEGELKIVTWGKSAVLSRDYVQKRLSRVFVVIWPEHLGSRRFTRGIDMQRLRREFKKLTGRVLPEPSIKLNSILVTHQGTKSDYLQILKVDPDEAQKLKADPDEAQKDFKSRYDTEPVWTLTPITVKSASTATLAIDNDDLYIIQTKDTLSNRVETQRLPGPHYYELQSAASTITAFKCKNSRFGSFCVDNGDLYFIKFKSQDPSSGKVEVHWAPNEKRFQSVTKYVTAFEYPSDFNPETDRAVISGGDLYLLVKGKDHLEVRCARGSSDYQETTTAVTGILLEELSRFYTIGLNGDLYMIKHGGTDHGSVEVWIARPANKNYSQIEKCLTRLKADGVQNVVVTPKVERRWII